MPAAAVWFIPLLRRPCLLAVLKGCTTRRRDVTNPDAITALAAEPGGVDVLFNRAGRADSGTIPDCDDKYRDFSFDLNVRAMDRMMRALLPRMLDRGGGSLIHTASVTSRVKGAPNRFVYGASKAAVIGMKKSVAAAFVTRSPRCNAICPGTIESPLPARAHRGAGAEQRPEPFRGRDGGGGRAGPVPGLR